MRAENVLGKKIARLRRERGITQAELAEQLHFTYQAVSNWERGVSEPDAETLLRLASFFGVSTDELLGKNNSASEPEVPPAGTAGESGRPRRVSPMLARSHAAEAVSAVEEQRSADVPPEILEESGRLMSRARGLRVSLIVFTVCSLAALLLSFFGNAAALLLIALPASIAADVAFIVAAVFFFLVKAPSASVAARTLFIAGIAVSETMGIALLFLSPENAAAYLSVALVVIGFGLFRAYLAPFAFRREGPVKGYLILITVQFACAVLSAFLSGSGWAILFDCAAQVISIVALWSLREILEDREAGVDYAAKNKAYRAAWKRNCRFAYLQWLAAAAFIVCLAAMGGLVPALGGYYIVDGTIPYGALPLYALEFIVFPLGFALCVWLWKAGPKNRALHWSLFALWAAAALVTFAYLFVVVCGIAGFPYKVRPWEYALCGAVEFIAFAGIVFLFPCKKGARRTAVRAAFCAAALVLSVACVLYCCFTPPVAQGGGPMFLLYGYMLLLFVLSFFLAERPPKAAKRSGNESERG